MAGIVGFTGPPEPSLLKRMLEAQSHRGTLIEPIIELPHVTLAVSDWRLAPKLGKTQSGVHALPNGESLACSGFLFSQPWKEGKEFQVDRVPQWLQDLRGSFVAAYVTEEKVNLIRDPVGCQALYFGKAADRWLFASEPKAIWRQNEFDCVISPLSVARYLAFSFVPGEETMLSKLYELQAGHTVCFDRESCLGDRVFQHQLFELQDSTGDCDDHSGRTQAEWFRETKTFVERAVAERLPNETEATAVFLSGGLDSSLVAAEIALQSNKPIHTFSIHFGNKYPNELSFAKAVADRIGSVHQEVLIEPKSFSKRFEEMVWHLDDPIGDPITQPNFELAGKVSKEFSAVFNGEGGDPLFGGPKNLPLMLQHWYGGKALEANTRVDAYLASYRRAYEEWERLLSPEFLQAIDAQQVGDVLTPFFQRSKASSFLNKLMAINTRLKGANLILPKVDRMLAAHGMTPLSPLFDDRLAKLSFRMPTNCKLADGIEKVCLKEAYRAYLPKEVIERPKSGMRVPVHYWFRRQLRRAAKNALSRQAVEAAGIFNYQRIKQLFDYDIEEGPGRYGLRLWMLWTLEVWRRQTGARW